MRGFLDSLRSDLLDRRFLPVLVLLGVALAAAIAFAVLGGGSSTSSIPTSATGVSTSASGPAGAVAITPAPSVNEAVAETTSGSHQRSGTPRNPFTPLPSAKAKSAATAPSTKPAAASSGSGSSHSSSTSSPSQPSTPKSKSAPKPSAPVKRVYIHYHVTAEFGLLPAVAVGAPAQPAQLKTFSNMALDEPLPSKENPQLLFLGVVLRTGTDAVFALTGAAILHGNAVCKPSPTQCQAIQLAIGQTETLEVIEANGQPATYELKLVSIAKSIGKASAAKAHAASSASSKAGRAFLRRAGLAALPGHHYSIETSFVRSGK